MKMTIDRKLIAGAMLMTLTALGASVSGWYAVQKLAGDLNRATGRSAQKLALAGQLKAAVNIMRTGQKGILLNAFQHDAKAAQATREDYGKRVATALGYVAQIRPLLDNAEENRRIAQLEDQIHQHAASFDKVASLCDQCQVSDAEAVYKQSGAPVGSAMEKAASEMMALIVEENAASSRAEISTTHTITAVSISITVLLAVLMTWFAKGVTRSLKAVVAQLADGAAQITAAATQISSSSQSLAQGASEQASSVTEASNAAQRSSTAAARSTEQSREAATVMNELDRLVEASNQTVGEMAASMAEITESSGKISKIVKLIDEIAFQTNILALNAAVEAARAGESGAGFAVVADEVRSLAQRSAQAARDTATLIEESIGRSGDGNLKLERVNEAIRGITAGDTRVKALVDEIRSSSEGQATGIVDVSRSLSEIERTTQSSAAFSQESAAASEELVAQAQALDQLAVDLREMVG